MNELMNNPAFQSALLPFLVALIAAGLLRKLGWVWAGLGFAIGYFSSVYLVMGIPQMPLTSTRKIVVLGAGAVLAGLLLDRLAISRRMVVALVALAAMVCAAWLIWPVVIRREGYELWFMLGAAVAYSVWLTTMMTALYGRAPEATMATLSLGLGTGVSALLGASALLGQLGIAVGAAAGAYAVLLLSAKELRLGNSFILPATLLSALAGIAAVVYASLPWYSLAPLMLAPLLVRMPLPLAITGNRRVVLLALMALPAAFAAVAVTWQQTGAPPF